MKKTLLYLGIGLAVVALAIMFRHAIKYFAVKLFRGTVGAMNKIDKKYKEKYLEMKDDEKAKAKDSATAKNKEDNES